jgi:hypothetical protein
MFTCETCASIRLLFKHIFHYINILFIQISTDIYYTMEVIVGTNGTSRHEIFVKGDSMAKCSSAGTYDVIFRDGKGRDTAHVNVTFTMKGLLFRPLFHFDFRYIIKPFAIPFIVFRVIRLYYIILRKNMCEY